MNNFTKRYVLFFFLVLVTSIQCSAPKKKNIPNSYHMKQIEKSLLDFEVVLNNKKIPVVNHLKEGVSIQEMDAFLLKNYGNADYFLIKEIFKWHNGIINNGILPDIKNDFEKIDINLSSIIPDYTLLSINQIDQLINDKETATLYQFKKKKLIPFLYDTGGEILAINIEELEANPQNARVIYCQLWDGESDRYIPMYDNLVSMIKTFIFLYQNDIYFFKDNELDMDFDEYYEQSSLLNPQSKYW